MAAEWGAGAVLVVVDVTMLVLVFKISARLGMGSPVLWVIGMLIPYIGTLVFFGFMRSVTRAFQGRGVQVGHFGPNPQLLAPKAGGEAAA